MSEIYELARDLGKIPETLTRNVSKVIPKTGMAMKKRMQKDFKSSKHFRQVAESVSYEVKEHSFGGSGVIQVEVGVDMQRGSAPGLNHIAYFGDSRGGGGTVPDPVVPMRLEAPVFFGFMEMASEGLL